MCFIMLFCLSLRDVYHRLNSLCGARIWIGDKPRKVLRGLNSVEPGLVLQLVIFCMKRMSLDQLHLFCQPAGLD